MSQLRKNSAKEKLNNGELVIAVACHDTDMIDVLGASGLVDAIWIEM